MSWVHIGPEAREKRRQKIIAQWADPEYRAKHAARLRAQATRASHSRKRKELTPEEIKARLLKRKVTHELWRAKRDAEGSPA